MYGTIKLTRKEWNGIKVKIAEEYPRSYLLIRETMRRELGFTVREHRWYTEKLGSNVEIHLDFYNDTQETWFRMKYL